MPKYYNRICENHDLLEFGRIIHGTFKALCIKKYKIDTGFEVFTFTPLVSYDAKRERNFIIVHIPTKDIETEYGCKFYIIKKKNQDSIKKFSDYFRVL